MLSPFHYNFLHHLKFGVHLQIISPWFSCLFLLYHCSVDSVMFKYIKMPLLILFQYFYVFKLTRCLSFYSLVLGNTKIGDNDSLGLHTLCFVATFIVCT